VFLSVDETGGLKVWQLSPAPRLETLPLSYPGTFTVGSRLLALATGQHISIIEIGKWHLSGPTTVSPAPVSTTLPVFSSNDDYFAYATESGFQVRKTTALDQVDWFAETSQPIPTRLRSLNISADGKTVQYGHLIYRKDRGVLDPDASWAELIKNLRAYTTICMPAPEREKVFLETKEEAKAKWETCETNRGRPQEPHPSPSGKNP
jgi:hypothetical protein